MAVQVGTAGRPPWTFGQRVRLGAWKALQVFGRYYILLMIPLSLLVLFLNFHGQGMQGIVPNYEDFKRIILAGFDPTAGIHGTPTFPMWGYGWLLLVTEGKTLLLLLQHALALWAAWTFIRLLERKECLPVGAITLLKCLLALSLPWYAFHSLRWPYSVATSLFLVSCGMFVDAVCSEDASGKRLVISGVLLGLMLNFRSDYIWMPFLFAAIVVAWKGWTGRIMVKVAVWLAAVYVLLLPWALYTKRATGHYLLTSTNAGHVLFIGLGNLPGNKWGITPDDGDPLMNAVIQERFGKKKSSLLYDTDRLLKAEFLRRVLNDPREYFRKVSYAFQSMLVSGVYTGEFFERPECRPTCFTRYLRMRERLRSNPMAFLLASGPRGVRVLLQVASGFVGRWVVFLSFLLLPMVAVLGWTRGNLLLLLVCGGIAYQAAINALAYNMATYTANMYFFHLITLCFGGTWLGHLLAAQHRLSAGKSRDRETDRVICERSGTA